MYKNENGRYMVRELEEGILKYPWDLEFEESEDSGGWNVVREYEGRYSAEEAIEEIIKVHMEGRINV